MKVYIVVCDYKLYGNDGFYSTNLGVYDSEEKAKNKVKELNQDWIKLKAKYGYDDYYEWRAYDYDIRTIL